jgi:hypothetical protein
MQTWNCSERESRHSSRRSKEPLRDTDRSPRGFMGKIGIRRLPARRAGADFSVSDAAGFRQGTHQLLEGLAFELTDTFAGQAQILANLT